MMAWYPVPQLMQSVVRAPNLLLGVSRYNRGYKGPTVQVRRSSDGSTIDCYSQADIAAHCAGTNGFATAVYDQSGNARDVVQVTSSRQAKVYDSVTGVTRSGSYAAMTFVLASSQYYLRLDTSGFIAGNVAYTVAFATSAWAYPAGSQIMLGVGPDTGGGAADAFYAGHNGALSMYTAIRLGSRSFDCSDPTSARTQFVVRKAAAANIDTATYRQNAASLTENSHASATLNLSLTSAMTTFGCNIQIAQFCQNTTHVGALWDLDLSGVDFTNLEQMLEAVRTS
jgi:hypothetical protein